MGITVSGRVSGARVRECVNTRGAIDIQVTAGCGDIDALAVVRVNSPLAAAIGGTNADDAFAVGRRVIAHIVICVTRSGNDRHTAGHSALDGGLQGRGAHSESRERQVDDIRGSCIVRNAGNRTARGPSDRGSDVGEQATAPRECANGLDLYLRRNTHDAHTVVRLGTDDARHRRAVP